MDGRGDSNVLGIRFINVHLEYVPNSIFLTFPNLQNLMIDEVLLTEFDARDFTNATRLRRIWASRNRIRQIGRQWFINTPLLLSLQLVNNEIETIHAEAFTGLTRMNNLNLDGNRLTSISGKFFAMLEGLLTLNLNNNQIETISMEDFEGLSALRTLQLRFNLFTEMPSNIFWNLPALQVVVLQNNQLTSINNLHFGRNLNLTDIRLTTNNISSIHPRAFDGLDRLNFVRLRQNRCVNRDFLNLAGNTSEVESELGPCIDNYPRKELTCEFQNYYSYTCLLNSVNIRLEHLVRFNGNHDYNFTNNEVFSVVINSSAIEFIPNEIFEEFPNLNLLMIQSSRLETLQPTTKCSSLQYFLAPKNRVTAISSNTFINCNQLSVVDLSENEIQSIAPEFLENSTTLGRLLLTGNKCVDRNFEITKESLEDVTNQLKNCFQ